MGNLFAFVYCNVWCQANLGCIQELLLYKTRVITVLLITALLINHILNDTVCVLYVCGHGGNGY